MFGVTSDITLSTIGTIISGNQNVNVNPITYLTIRSSTLKQRLVYENIVPQNDLLEIKI
jgi:hypothetical protein